MDTSMESLRATWDLRRSKGEGGHFGVYCCLEGALTHKWHREHGGPMPGPTDVSESLCIPSPTKGVKEAAVTRADFERRVRR